jgi:hypothetical protein
VTLRTQTTASFLLEYDDATVTRTDGDALLGSLTASCERDFATLVSVFGGVRPSTPITVTVNLSGGGVNDGKNMTIGSGGIGAAGPFDPLRNTFIAELDEIFMSAQNKKWNPSDSKGEALSRALGGVMYPDGQSAGFTVHQWVDNDPDLSIDAEAVVTASGRQDWVTKTFAGNATAPGDIPAKPTGCGVAFLFYLHDQLGFSWAKIVSAAADTLEGVHRQLSGADAGFASFLAAVDGEFPPGQRSSLNDTAVRPFSDGFEQTATRAKPAPRALLSPNGLTPAPLRTPGHLSIRRFLFAQGVHGAARLRTMAVDAARPIGAPALAHDPLSRVGLRGLVNTRRKDALA